MTLEEGGGLEEVDVIFPEAEGRKKWPSNLSRDHDKEEIPQNV